MDVRDKLFPIFIKEAAKNLKILQHFLLDAALSGSDPDELEAAFRAAHTLKGTALLVQVDSVHQIGRRIEALLERHLSAKTGPTVVECEAMELAVAWLQRLLIDLQEGRSGSTSLVADALTALELAARFPGKTHLVELLDSDAQQRAPHLDDPFASDPELLLDDEEILRIANDPFADDPDFGIGSSLLPDPVEVLTQPAEPDQADSERSLSASAVDLLPEIPAQPLQPKTSAANCGELPFDPFADDCSFVDDEEEISISAEELSQDSLPAAVAHQEPSADQAETGESLAAVTREAVAQLEDPFADDSGFEQTFTPEPADVSANAEAAAKFQDESVAATGSVADPDAINNDRTQELVDSLLLPNAGVGLQRRYVCCCFDLSGGKYYLPIEYMIEIAEIPQLFPLPLAPPLVSGLINLRSQVMPVIDLSSLKQRQQQPVGGVRRLVVVEHQGERLAFLAEGIPCLSEELIGDRIDLPTFLQEHKIRGLEV